MRSMTIFNLLRGVFSAKVIETGAAFFEALFEQITEHVSRDNKAKADYDRLEKRVAIIEQRNHINVADKQQISHVQTMRGRRKDILLASDVNEEQLINNVKEYLRGKRVDDNEVDMVKYVIPTQRFALFLYQILDRKGLIAHGENPQMRYSAYGRFLHECTGLNYDPARQNYMRMQHCYNAFCLDGKEIKMYELDICNVPIGFKHRADAELLRRQYDYLEVQLCIFLHF